MSPRHPDDLEPRTRTLSVKVTETELQGFDQLCEREGLSRSELLRQLVNQAILERDPDFFAQLETLKLKQSELDRLIDRARRHHARGTSPGEL